MEHDDDIMQKVASGDMDAFARIVERYQETIWRISRRYCGDAHEAEDITQDTFIKLLDSASRYRPSGKFSSYLMTIACRICLDRSAKKKPVLSDDLPDLVDNAPSVASVREQGEREQQLSSALATLPENQRVAVLLRYYENMDYAGIASVLQTTPKSVDGLLTRARKTLANRIAPPD